MTRYSPFFYVKALLVIALSGMLLSTAFPLLAQNNHSASITGFPDDRAKCQFALEQEFASNLDPVNLRHMLKLYSAKPHHTGSAGGLEVAEDIAAKFRSWGFETDVEVFYALMSEPKTQVVEMIQPSAYRAALQSPLIPGYTAEQNANSLPPYNVYSSDGEVTAQAVYVNYGMVEDYQELAHRGIDVRGKIVIARYGKAFRGIKPRLAGERGAVGVILYSDPMEYGSARGAVYPAGPFLPEDGYQRGSVMNLSKIAGDPLTPGTGALQPPTKITPDQVALAATSIPVVPLSAHDIRPILQAMVGPAAPEQWQGALPLTYRFGGSVVLRLKVHHEWGVVPLHNVVAKLEGSRWPDQWVLRGNNHDAWNYGAQVALSGLIAMMEEARAISLLTKKGWRPKRTLVYLAWDGEEQGLLGSTEWTEAHAGELAEKAVIYINSGVTTQGILAAGGSHSLETMVNEVAKAVTDPIQTTTVYDRIAANILDNGSDLESKDIRESGRFRLTPLGLGSDFTPFLQHIGIPSLDIGFDGDAPNGVYHSVYDNFDFYDRFGDPGYRYGLKLAELGGRIMLRCADADILPFDFLGMSHAISQYVSEIKALVKDTSMDTVAKQPAQNLDFKSLEDAIEAMESSAHRFLASRSAYESLEAVMESKALSALNAGLARAEQVFAPKHGLPSRPWYRHHIYAPDYDTGYAVATLPSIREAVQKQEWGEAQDQIVVVAQLVEAYAGAINQASQSLKMTSLQN